MKKSIIALAVTASFSFTAGLTSAATINMNNSNIGTDFAIMAPLPGTGRMVLNVPKVSNAALGTSNIADIEATAIADPSWLVNLKASKDGRVSSTLRKADIIGVNASNTASGSVNSITFVDEGSSTLNLFKEFGSKKRGTVSTARNLDLDLSKTFSNSAAGVQNVIDTTYSQPSNVNSQQIGQNKGIVASRATNLSGAAKSLGVSAVAVAQSIQHDSRGGNLTTTQLTKAAFQKGDVEALYQGTVDTSKILSVSSAVQSAALNIEDVGTLKMVLNTNLSTNTNGQDAFTAADLTGTKLADDISISANGLQSGLSADVKRGDLTRSVVLANIGDTTSIADFGNDLIATGEINVNAIGASSIDNLEVQVSLSSLAHVSNLSSIGDVYSDVSANHLSAKALSNLAAGSYNVIKVEHK